jgi:hypothetical protein
MRRFPAWKLNEDGMIDQHSYFLPREAEERSVADVSPPSRKFGKQIQKRQLEVPEYAASFVNYKALKKVRLREVSAAGPREETLRWDSKFEGRERARLTWR